MLDELYILKDHYNIGLYNRVIKEVEAGEFRSLDELETYLSSEIFVPESSNEPLELKQHKEIEVDPVLQQEVTDTITLDRILYRIEELMKE